MGKKRIKYYLIIIFFLMSMFTYANWGSKGPPLPKPNGPPGDGGYPQLPIDGGVTFLLIIGTAFGIYKLKKK